MARPPARFERIAFTASPAPEAQVARTALIARYGDADPASADVIVALGGDGFMLQTLHKFMTAGKPISRAVTAPWDRGPPLSVITAAAL